MQIRSLILCPVIHLISLSTAFAIPVKLLDTLIRSNKISDSLVLSLQKEKLIPSPERVTLISAYTHKGFRDLFSRFEYLPNIPYVEQINPQAKAFMEDYIRKNKKNLTGLQQHGLIYFNLIESVFRQYGLPVELKYLAVIESGLKFNAISLAGAVGPWQLMPSTARNYGLMVNSKTDQRTDYTKSTHAAARLLFDLYGDFHDWLLVLAAYNGGKGRVLSAMKKSGKKDFWSLQQYLPEESRNHVKKFIATHYVMESGDPYKLMNILNKDSSIIQSAPLENKIVNGRFSSSIIATELGMTSKEFNLLNPAFQIQLVTKGETTLYLPAEKMRLFEVKKDSIFQKSVESLLAE